MFFPTAIGVIGAFVCFGAAIMEHVSAGAFERNKASLERDGVLTPVVIVERSRMAGSNRFQVVYVPLGEPDKEENHIWEEVSDSDFQRFRVGETVQAWILGDKHLLQGRTFSGGTPVSAFLLIGVMFASLPVGGLVLKKHLLRLVPADDEEAGGERSVSAGTANAQLSDRGASAKIPKEPLRTATRVSTDRSHSLSQGPGGLRLVRSRQRLYAGVALLLVYCVAALLLPSSAWRYLFQQAGWAGISAIALALAASAGSLIISYLVSRKLGIQVEFDTVSREVSITRGRTRKTLKLKDLAAVQVCCILVDTPSPYWGHQLNLVFRHGEGYERVCVMNCSTKRSVWGIAKAIAQRVSIPLLDCATREHWKAEMARFDRYIT